MAKGRSKSPESRAPKPSRDLKSLDRLVGTWKVSDPTGRGGIDGTSRYEWMEGGFFLIQYVELDQNGNKNSGIELIGPERPFGATEPGKAIKSRFYSNTGDTLNYEYELEGDTLTIWGGEKGSPGYYKGTFSADGDVLTGSWVWPGGGYQARSTKVTS